MRKWWWWWWWWWWYVTLSESGGLLLPSLIITDCHDSYLSHLITISNTLQDCDHWSWKTWCHDIQQPSQTNRSCTQVLRIISLVVRGFCLNYFFVLGEVPWHLLLSDPTQPPAQQETLCCELPRPEQCQCLESWSQLAIITAFQVQSKVNNCPLLGHSLTFFWLSYNQGISKRKGGVLCSWTSGNTFSHVSSRNKCELSCWFVATRPSARDWHGAWMTASSLLLWTYGRGWCQCLGPNALGWLECMELIVNLRRKIANHLHVRYLIFSKWYWNKSEMV